MRRSLIALAVLAALCFTPTAFAAGNAGSASAEPAPVAAADLATDTAPDLCVEVPASEETLDTEPMLAAEEASCLVCWRDRDCNTYCGGPWGVCHQGCCACTQ